MRLGIVLLTCACGATELGVPNYQPNEASTGDSSDARDASVVAHDAGNGLHPCKQDYDCFGSQTCQAGFCCDGTLKDGICMCGSTRNCDLQHECCKAFVCPDHINDHPIDECLQFGKCPSCFHH